MANAYSDRVTMIVTQSGADRVGQWVPQVRNVAEDIKKIFTPSSQPIKSHWLPIQTTLSKQPLPNSKISNLSVMQQAVNDIWMQKG